MEVIKWIFLIILPISVSGLVNAQQEHVDSLKHQLRISKRPQETWTQLYEVARAYQIKIRDYDSAHVYALKAYQSAEILDEEEFLLKSFYLLGYVHRMKRNFDSAFFYLGKALEYDVSPSEYPRTFGLIYNTLGLTHSSISNYTEAAIAYREASVFFMKADDQKMLSWAYDCLGIAESKLGNFERAIEAHLEALRISERLNDPKSLLRSINNLGVAYNRKGDMKNMITYYRKALDISLDLDDIYYKGHAFSNVTNAFLEMKQYDSAWVYGKQALEMAKRLGDRISECFRTRQLGLIAFEQGKYTVAETLVLAALSISQNLQDDESEGNCRKILGMVYYALGDYRSAMQEYKKSANIFSSMKVTFQLVDIYKSLSETLERLGRTTEALQYYKHYKSLSDSIASESLETKVAELELKYETEKKQLKIDRLTIENESKAALAQTRLWIILLGSMCFVALAFIFYFRIKLNKQRSARLKAENKQNELALSLKRQELTSLSLNLTRKNEALQKLKYKIQSENEEWSSKKVIKFIEKEVAMDTGWDHFKMHFEKVHQGFFDRLRSIAPAITLNEQKLCAYLVLNLSSKEIAQLLHTSLSAVEKSRYRLRKKLQMNPETNLTSFVQSI